MTTPDTRQLEALRDALTNSHPVTGQQPLCVVTKSDIDRAIAALREQPAQQGTSPIVGTIDLSVSATPMSLREQPGEAHQPAAAAPHIFVAYNHTPGTCATCGRAESAALHDGMGITAAAAPQVPGPVGWYHPNPHSPSNEPKVGYGMSFSYGAQPPPNQAYQPLALHADLVAARAEAADAWRLVRYWHKRSDREADEAERRIAALELCDTDATRALVATSQELDAALAEVERLKAQLLRIARPPFGEYRDTGGKYAGGIASNALGLDLTDQQASRLLKEIGK